MNAFEEVDEPLSTWELPDLILHNQTRKKTYQKNIVATFRFLNKLKHPDLKNSFEYLKKIHLAKVNQDIENLLDNKLNFFKVIENRKSIREKNYKTITIDQLSTMVWYVGRIKSFKEKDRSNPENYSFAIKPIPGAGGTHEIDIHLTVSNCDGLEAGHYYYNPFDHELQLINKFSDKEKTLIENFKYSTKENSEINILIHLSARFARMAWKYESIACSVILLNAGIHIAQFYLVATALGLSPCACGWNDSILFSEIIKKLYLDSSSVVEIGISGKLLENR